MNITIITAGGRGDVQPYVALGKGLKDAGHSVSMPAADEFCNLIVDAGLKFIKTTSVNPREFVQSMKMKKAAESRNKLKSIIEMFNLLKPMMEAFYNETLEACQGSDLVITTLLATGARDSAQKLGIPCIHTTVVPLYPTSSFSAPMMPHFFNLGIYNRITHKLVEQALWQPFRPIVNKWRKNVLGLKPCNFWGNYRDIYKGGVPVLSGFSPTIIPKPIEWPDSIRITGYWFLSEPLGWKPSKELEAFLDSGPAPVYIGFGSMVDKEPEKITGTVLDALKLSGQRGILYSGWNGLGNVQLPDTVFKVDSIPHSWLFKRMSAVVHHGGAGTTAATLCAGVPSIITPFLGDQPFWGERISSFGVGTKPIPYSKLTPENLAERIKTALNNTEMKKKAKLLGKKIESENGVKKAVEIIESITGSELK